MEQLSLVGMESEIQWSVVTEVPGEVAEHCKPC